jgi:hypothetical protein
MDELDPGVEWHPALAVLLGGKQTVFRGHQGVRESIQEEDEALSMYQLEVSEIRDLGDRVLRDRTHTRPWQGERRRDRIALLRPD